MLQIVLIVLCLNCMVVISTDYSSLVILCNLNAHTERRLQAFGKTCLWCSHADTDRAKSSRNSITPFKMAQSYSRPKPSRNESHASMPNIVDRLYIGPIHRRSHDIFLEGARRPRNFFYACSGHWRFSIA